MVAKSIRLLLAFVVSGFVVGPPPVVTVLLDGSPAINVPIVGHWLRGAAGAA